MSDGFAHGPALDRGIEYEERGEVDLYKAIRELIEERKRIDRIIVSLEAMLASGAIAGPGNPARKTTAAKRRGRKSMSPEERIEVSERMARYWAARRAGQVKKSESDGDAEPITS